VTQASQSEFEETITDMLYRQLKGIMAIVEQQVQNLVEEMGNELQATRLT
jgi:exonuclease VII small subunit